MLLFVFYSHILLRLNFSSASLFLWFMTIAHVTNSNLRRNPAKPLDLLFGFFLGMSILVRPDLILIAFTLSLPGIATFMLQGNKKRLIYVLIPLLLLAGANFASKYLYKPNENYIEFTKFNTIRSKFNDTGASKFNANTTEALNKAGWTMGDYYLAKHWWYHDNEIYSTEKLSEFIKYNQSDSASMLSKKTVLQTLKTYHLYLWYILVIFYLFNFFQA